MEPAFFSADNKKIYALSNRGRDTKALVMIDPAHPADEKVLFVDAQYDAAEAVWSRKLNKLTRLTSLTIETRPAQVVVPHLVSSRHSPLVIGLAWPF